MNISKLALALTSVLFAASTASAQLSAYGTVTVRRMTDIPYTQGSTTNTNGSIDPVGGTGGIFYDFRNVGPVRLGVDARGSIVNSTQGAYSAYNAGGGHIRSGLAGIRATFHTPFVPLKPYVQGSVGVASTNFGTQYNSSLATSGVSSTTGVQYSTHLEYDAFAGLDISILPVLDFRVVELGYGAVEGNSHTYPLGTISTGIVFHLPFGLGK
ncbi:hypothetical protein [Granulicella arctica]|uniref:Outer membrane protein beta-barrel domain-containing protein n=1 Tax=Granulicella arctica TaxID=940613 RepID=A0A7Y9PFV0_9BACT|nr:hypothetical protein [Granulicella arctica]NYF79148.1 hypothetical protein [Granulicella arctica]